VKEIKPHEERFFKDIVLKSILDEISSEQGKPLPDLITASPSRYKKKYVALFSFLSVSIIALAALTIPLTMKVTEPVSNPVLTEKYTLLQADKQEEKEIADIQQPIPPELRVETTDESLIIVSDSAKTSIGQKPQNEHEAAKAQLLQQMKD
jgi:hypothetical protein